MEYIYSLYDPQTNKLLYRGTPEQLVKAGLYKRKNAVSAAYRVQVKGARPRRYRIERERADAEAAAARHHKPQEKPQPRSRSRKQSRKERTRPPCSGMYTGCAYTTRQH